MSDRWAVERAVLGSDLASTGRLVMLALLAFTDNGTAEVSREYGPSLTGLAEATALDRATIARTLNVLEVAGWVKRDRPDPYAARSQGARTAYSLCPAMGSRTGQPGSRTGRPPVVAQDHMGSRTVRPSPEASRSLPAASSTAKIVTDNTDATEQEAHAVLEKIAAERNPRSLPGLVRRMAADGDLTEWVDKVRDHDKASRAAQAARQPHRFKPGRSQGYCKECARHETNRIHATAAQRGGGKERDHE